MIIGQCHRPPRWRRLAGLLGLGIWSLSLAAPMARAEDVDPVLSSRIYHRLAHLQADFEAGRFVEVRAQLLNLLPTTRDNNRYDRAVLLQLLGQAQIQLEEPEQAIAAFEEATALDVLPNDDALHLARDLARLYVSKARYADAAATLEHLPGQDRDSRLLLAQSYLQLARYRDALKPLKELIRDSRAPGKNLYEALFFAQHALGETPAAIATLQRLIALDPGAPAYWRQLASLHYESGSADHALAVLEAAYRQGVLEDLADDLLNLVSLYRAEGASYKGAVLLEQLLDEQQLEDRIALREQLVDLWLAARETARAARTLERLIAHSPTPERWLRLGQLHIDQRRWSAAAQALETAINADAATGKRLSTERLADAWLWLGIVYFESGRRQAAHAAFHRSESFAFTRPAAQQWLRYLETSG